MLWKKGPKRKTRIMKQKPKSQQRVKRISNKSPILEDAIAYTLNICNRLLYFALLVHKLYVCSHLISLHMNILFLYETLNSFPYFISSLSYQCGVETLEWDGLLKVHSTHAITMPFTQERISLLMDRPIRTAIFHTSFVSQNCAIQFQIGARVNAVLL